MLARAALYLICYVTEFAGILLIFAVSRGLGDMDTDMRIMGVVGGGTATFMGLSSYFCGRWSDRLSPGWFVGSGMVLMGLSFIVCASTDSAMRIGAYWLASWALGMVPPQVYARLSRGVGVQGRARGVGTGVILFSLMWNCGLISGQLSGGWLYHTLGPDWPIYLAVVLVVVNLGLFAFAWPRTCAARALTNEAPDTAAPTSRSGDLANQQRSLMFAKLAWVANVGSASAMSMTLHLLPRLAADLKIEPHLHGEILALMRGVVVATYFALFLFSFWHHRIVPAMCVQGLAVVGLMIVAQATGPGMLMIGLIAVAPVSGYNYFASLYYSTMASSPANRGRATGIHAGTHLLGFAIGAFVGGLVGHYGRISDPYRLAAAMILVLGVVQVVLYLRGKRLNKFSGDPANEEHQASRP